MRRGSLKEQRAPREAEARHNRSQSTCEREPNQLLVVEPVRGSRNAIATARVTSRRCRGLVYTADAERSRDQERRNKTSMATHILQPARRASASSILLNSSESSHTAAAKSNAMLGGLLWLTVARYSKLRAASSATQTTVPWRHSRDQERARMGVRRDETLHNRSQTPESRAKRGTEEADQGSIRALFFLSPKSGSRTMACKRLYFPFVGCCLNMSALNQCTPSMIF
jgi:hypothetical protein